MNFSPFSRDRDRPLEYYVIVLHASEARVLLVPEGAGWTLPHFTPAVTDFRWVRHINEHMRALLPTSPRESRFSMAYSHPYEGNPMTWRAPCRSRPRCTRSTNLTN